MKTYQEVMVEILRGVYWDDPIDMTTNHNCPAAGF
ncbi:MAG: hypothetical protein Ta2E_10980 [Mycoplasmoidaceae bacterium]|nr:MAG: hypothetical protein Ta2E_10980 [Mycoplasmoidaceae bacterium]